MLQRMSLGWVESCPAGAAALGHDAVAVKVWQKAIRMDEVTNTKLLDTPVYGPSLK